MIATDVAPDANIICRFYGVVMLINVRRADHGEVLAIGTHRPTTLHEELRFALRPICTRAQVCEAAAPPTFVNLTMDF